ncbi:peroxiredoxin [Billgrantia antri]|uniref:Glutathione-dependent peroxiredoxin n=1 Tax=Halomonas sulfidivorans TaxID=2733488 RepID=A0ABX7WD61_9GAMM|nr:peroxiredoxin [Halomonas sulfidivorans]QTP58343.1 peroxiredoxin [Halomonas sulfidivorans]
MPISVGDKIPDVTLKTNGPDGPEDISTGELFAGKRVVLFGVPGAFTPGCSNTHMPGFVIKADKVLEKADTLACMAVNDAFVMRAWQKDQNAEAILMLADGNAELTRALGMEKDASGACMGTRSLRFALIAEDGVATYVGIDTERGVVDKSSVDTVLAHLAE